MIYLRISAILGLLLAVFLLGMWLTWPELAYNSTGFPINRNFVAVSLNGEPLTNAELPRPQTLQRGGNPCFACVLSDMADATAGPPPWWSFRRNRSSGATSTELWWRAAAPACARSAISRLCSARRDGVGRSAR
jgi:hypothetical protein